jgi:hypothetical protein
VKQITHEGSVSCPSCHLAIPASKKNFGIYFATGDELQCPSCSASLNWWDLISEALSEGFLGLQYAPIGARTTVTEVRLKQGELAEVDFNALGIPESARILDVVYTANEKRLPVAADGLLFPLEMHSNKPDRPLLPGRPIMLYPMPMPLEGAAPPQEQGVNVLIIWIDKGALSLADSSLLSAVEALNGDRYADAVVSATAAVEVSVDAALTTFFERTAGTNAVADLMRGRSAGKVEVLVPSMCATIGMPPLPTAPSAAFRSLRSLRNKAAHAGHLPADTTGKQVADGVAGAIFAVAHAQGASETLAAKLS